MFLPPVKQKKSVYIQTLSGSKVPNFKKKKKNHINNQIALQFFAMCPSKFLIFVTSELLSTKTEEYKTN